MKTFLVLGALISVSAMAEYRFNSRHPIKLSANSNNDVIASLCYDDFHHCTSSLKIGTTEELSAFIQKQIFHRKDVTLRNFDKVMSQSMVVLNSNMKELIKRLNEQKKFAGRDPIKAEALKSYVAEAQARVANAQQAIAYLAEGKTKATIFDQEFNDIIKGAKNVTFSRTYSYGIEDFLFRGCNNKADLTDCWHAGLQFFMTDRGVDQESHLIATAVRRENEINGFPKKMASGLEVALLSADFTHAGTSHPSQTTTPVEMSVTDNYKAQCLATTQSGKLSHTKVGCEALGKNWRFPTVKELRSSAVEMRALLPEVEGNRVFQTMNVNGFVNPGNANLIECKPIYLNLTSGKAINNQIGLARSFIFGKDPSQGASAVCVCEKDC